MQNPIISMLPDLDSTLLIASVTLLLAAFILIIIVFGGNSKVNKARKSLEKQVVRFHIRLINKFMYESSSEVCDMDHEFCNCKVYRI